MTFKPKALDLFCCAGGASMGLHQAGFEVVGVDLIYQKNYPFRFTQADALTIDLSGFDFIWASPPCQSFSNLNFVHKKDYPNLIPDIRERLLSAKVPYIIENVEGARTHLINPVLLCGAMFGLKTYRHRLFESNISLASPVHCRHDDNTPSVGRGMSKKGFVSITGNGGFGIPDGLNYARAAIGINWTNRTELSQAIPPAYSRFLGEQILEKLN